MALVLSELVAAILAQITPRQDAILARATRPTPCWP